MKILIFSLCMLLIAGCCSDSCCDAEKDRIAELTAALENCKEEPLFSGKYVRLYVLNTHAKSNLYKSESVLLGVYNKSGNSIPAFSANLENSQNLEYYQKIWCKISKIGSGQLKITEYTTTKPANALIVDFPRFSLDGLKELIKHTVDLYHDHHHRINGAHKIGHIIKNFEREGNYFKGEIKSTIMRNGVRKDTTITYLANSLLTKGEVHFKIIDQSRNLIEIESSDHYPHPQD